MRALLAVLLLCGCSGGVVPNPDGGTGGGTSGSGGGSSGTGGGSAGGSAGSSGGGTGGSGGGAAVDGGVCSPVCTAFRTCCDDECVNTDNNPEHCGACFRRCQGSTPYCAGGNCMPRPCDRDGGTSTCTLDGGAGFCCGASCCAAGDLCCKMEGPVSIDTPVCFTPTDAGVTCPGGCAPQCASDRAAKRDVLQQVSSMRFVVEAGHLSSSADPIDVHGTTLAAIQALHAALREQAARLERLEAENRRLRAGELTCGP